MKIETVTSDRRNFLRLLLLADEQENMIEKYLERGDMFALYDDDELKTVCLVTREREGIYELKNIATAEQYQRRGYGKKMLNYILDFYRGHGNTMYVGTGENTAALTFYESVGFRYSHRIANFFTKNYDHPIFESGKRIVDMVYLKKEL